MSDAWDGRPQNPERDGWHWLRSKQFHNAGELQIARWRAGKWMEPNCSPERLAKTDNYEGPILTPEEHAALLAERDVLRARVDGALDLAERHMNEKHRVMRQSATDWEALQSRIKDAEAALATARREAAEAMREKAAALADHEEAYSEKRANTESWHDQTWHEASAETAGTIARKIRALPLPGDET